MTRKQALATIKAAAAQGDMQSATRIYIENRVSYAAFQQACREGRALRQFIERRDAAQQKAA